MKMLGMVLIIVAAALFSYEQGARVDRQVRLLEELFSFIERVKIDIGCYLRPISEIASDFSSEVLSEAGFLSDVAKLGAHEAYKRLSERTVLDKDTDRLLSGFFSKLGHGYAEDEIKLIDLTLAELSEILKREREDAPKQKKLSLTLSSAGALALIILLV